MEGTEPKNLDIERQNREKPRRKRYRPRTKGYRLFVKDEIEKALCAQPSPVNHLFSTDDSGICSASLDDLVSFLELNSESYSKLSVAALKSISNISSIFRIDGSPSEGLRIFRKSVVPKQDSTVVYVDNLPMQCRLLYVLRRASMFGTVASVRPRFFGEREEKLCYTFSSERSSASSKTVSLFSTRRVESAFIQFVDPSSAEKFCRAYKLNMPGNIISPGKRIKRLISKRKKSAHRAIAYQKSAYLSKKAYAQKGEACGLVEESSLADSFVRLDGKVTLGTQQTSERFSPEEKKEKVEDLRKRKGPSNSPLIAHKRCCRDEKEFCTNNQDRRRTVSSSYETVERGEEKPTRYSDTTEPPRVVDELVEKVPSDIPLEHDLCAASSVTGLSRLGKLQKGTGLKECVQNDSPFVADSESLVAETKLFNEYRSEYLKLKKNNMVNLKRMLSLKTISWRSFSSNSMRVRKIRGKSKLVARAVASRSHQEQTGVRVSLFDIKLMCFHVTSDISCVS
ncbi:unnamed protein product [Enterobius vermicularis]|uniref:RRM domain-containing protein n=1 Tax=Enterobius vermicularis TaxID=51028 RepID=A0A0N4V9S5_ENTVE|nr:unnamed protein product [Enterobius vermicularis]